MSFFQKINFSIKALILLAMLSGMSEAFGQTNIQVTGLSVDNAAPNEGKNVTNTVTIKNNGPQATTVLKIVDLLPAGLTYQSYSTASGTYTPGTGIWTIGTLNDNVTVALTLTATVNTGQTGVTSINTASVTAINEPDPMAANSTACEPITVRYPDIQITKTVSVGPVNEDNNLTGSVIIDMSVNSQSMGNGLKPIGQIYTHILSKSPIARSIEATITENGIDFNNESKQLTEDSIKGILFTSPENRQTTISSRINTRKDKV